ncbi:Uncharacterized protein AXF42_Ash012546 [Apostasia shenzhenica]|uniref:DUF7054 domain-containing protein n=1 Tax=Apostasia shenzhenica TaxID=1088818 RepID=A0A2I0AR29_9ASPA|nr:Uncharacterized protein AXF42_Ash012546 [Apostasia shenzhenica]
MTDNNNRLCSSSGTSAAGGRRPPNPAPSPHRRTTAILHSARRQKPAFRVLPRSASEPILWILKCDGVESGSGGGELLLRRRTCIDLFSPPLWPRSPSIPPPGSVEETKVVVSVTVEGSAGPVRALMRLGASVEEAIGVTVERYGREGRSPRLDCDSSAFFELHHSSLQSLNKSDKIGDVGGRSFYLRTNSGSRSFISGREASDAGYCTEGHDRNPLFLTPELFFSTITKKLKKMERRTKKFWKVVTCILCV